MLNGVVYVGGGDSDWYALDASTGAVLWDVNTGDNSATAVTTTGPVRSLSTDMRTSGWPVWETALWFKDN